MQTNRLAIIVLVVILLSAFGTFAQGYKVGDEAMDFELKNIDGKVVSLKSLEETKGAIVIFTCNHCPFSKAYEERIIALDEKFKPLGYPVVAINPNDPEREPADSFAKMQERAKEKDFSFPYLVDATQEVAKTYGASKTPHVYVLQLQEGGKYIVSYIGAIDNNVKDGSQADKLYVEEAIGQLLKGTKVKNPETKAVGCTIKWKEA